MGEIVSRLQGVGRMKFLVATDFSPHTGCQCLVVPHNAWPLNLQSQQRRFSLVWSSSYALHLSDFLQETKDTQAR